MNAANTGCPLIYCSVLEPNDIKTYILQNIFKLQSLQLWIDREIEREREREIKHCCILPS